MKVQQRPGEKTFLRTKKTYKISQGSKLKISILLNCTRYYKWLCFYFPFYLCSDFCRRGYCLLLGYMSRWAKETNRATVIRSESEPSRSVESKMDLNTVKIQQRVREKLWRIVLYAEGKLEKLETAKTEPLGRSNQIALGTPETWGSVSLSQAFPLNLIWLF